MTKYHINKEFFPYTLMHTPVMPPKLAGWMGSLMRTPRWIHHDREVSVTSEQVAVDGGEIEVLIFRPKGRVKPSPALVYCHGGGFFFGAADYHYRLAGQYAFEIPCTVVFVQYRLAPKHPFPIPAEDCYAAYLWTSENAERLNIVPDRIAVGGDSAGGCLAAAVPLMCRDRKTKMPHFQLLVYPVTDRRMQTESNRKYTDTPMWHSRLSEKMWEGYLPDGNPADIAYASPMEAVNFTELPPAYVESAEFDCLHDEAVLYAQAMADAGVNVELNETRGTMHGFDIAMKTETAKSAVRRRIDYMKRMFL